MRNDECGLSYHLFPPWFSVFPVASIYRSISWRNAHLNFGGTMNLRILGGESVRRTPWPKWPVLSTRARALMNEALDSGRWTISGQALTLPRFDREIGERWAEYVGVRYALPCSSGTAGLTMAL